MRRLLREARSQAYPLFTSAVQQRIKQQVKSSDTLFVLGSGSSVCDLSPDFLRSIEAHDSLGLNFWLIHDLVPTYYFVESSHVAERNEVFNQLITLKAKQYRNTYFFPHYDLETFGRPDLLKLPPQESENVYATIRWKLATVDPKALQYALRVWWFALRRYGPYHGISSAVAAVTFGMMLGYRDIVLVGVDLSNTLYFWEADPDKYRGVPTPPNIEGSGVHYTADREKVGFYVRQLPIQEQLRILADDLCRRQQIRLWTASERSMLSSFLPVYRAEQAATV
ncbi:MAG TPA: hypothetical protein VG713_12535 [Pirellulales bacterium]|nr:hypothetical protein [Pirellulales bacterium]